MFFTRNTVSAIMPRPRGKQNQQPQKSMPHQHPVTTRPSTTLPDDPTRRNVNLNIQPSTLISGSQETASTAITVQVPQAMNAVSSLAAAVPPQAQTPIQHSMATRHNPHLSPSTSIPALNAALGLTANSLATSNAAPANVPVPSTQVASSTVTVSTASPDMASLVRLGLEQLFATGRTASSQAGPTKVEVDSGVLESLMRLAFTTAQTATAPTPSYSITRQL